MTAVRAKTPRWAPHKSQTTTTDSANQITALTAMAMMFEMISMVAETVTK